MFVTNDEGIWQKAKMLWSFGETRTPLETRDNHAYALGWMYRGSDLPAAFGRAQLTKLDRYLKVQKEHAALLLELLEGTPALILPTEPKGFTHNWYNFTTRIDMKEAGWKGEPRLFRNAVMAALKAEGARVGVWQSFILPAMTVFQAQNAYGHGCPWDCRLTEPVKYDPAAYPVAQLHTDTHFGMTYPLRLPNGRGYVRATARAFRKVFANLDQLDVEKITAPKK